GAGPAVRQDGEVRALPRGPRRPYDRPMASTSSTSGTAVRRRVTHPGSLAMIVGGLCVFVGSVLPWISTPLGDIPGHASYLGWATMAAAPLAFAGAVLPFRRVAIVHCLVVAI